MSITTASRPATPVVRTHPDTGRKSLYISRDRMDHIVGMDRAEGHRLIDDLTAHAIQPRFVYRHKWRTGDLVIWDNRCLIHKANGDYPEWCAPVHAADHRDGRCSGLTSTAATAGS